MAVFLSPVGGVAAQFFTNTGAVLTGGKIYTYLAGTTTPAITYTNSGGATAWTNPIVLDAAGRVSGSGEIWLADGVQYKFVLKDANDVLIATYDNILGINASFSNFIANQEIQTATANQTVFTLANSYTPAANTLSVFVDGVNQYGPGAAYAYFETNSNTVTFVNGLHVGALVKFTTVQSLTSTQSTTAALVSYTPAGIGAVTTTVQTKLRETVSVADFGAVGDGVTNDAIAIQAALNSGAKVVNFVANGTYKISSAISVPANVVIQGNNASVTCPTHFTLFTFVNGGGVFNLNMTGAGGATYVAGSTAIKCNGTNNAPSAPTYVTGPIVENCKITAFGEYGVFLKYVKIARIASNQITVVGYAGIGGVSCEDITVNNNIIKNITAGSAGGDAYGVFIDREDGASETAEPRSYRCVITNNLIENISATAANNGQGIDTHAGVDFIIDSNQVKNCEAGIFLTASSISGVQELAPLRCVVSNNIVSTNIYSNYGILVYGARTGATVAQHAEDCVVTGNIVLGHGSKTSSTIPSVFLSATKNVVVTSNVFKQSGASCVMLDFQNINANISSNEFIDPVSNSFSSNTCVYVYSIDNRGYIGNNSYRFENAALATYVATNAVRIESGLTGLDLDFGRSTFQGIDATHLSFLPLTTAGVRYSGFFQLSGSNNITVTSGVADGITDVTFSKRFPYTPNINLSLNYPFNQGGKRPMIGVDVTTVVPTPTGFRVYAQPYDGTTWSATGSLSFYWQAD